MTPWQQALKEAKNHMVLILVLLIKLALVVFLIAMAVYIVKDEAKHINEKFLEARYTD